MGAKAKILVVEDEEDFRAILVHLLQGEGYEVVAKSNGEEGLAAYADSQPDLVLLDVNLPDTTGIDICRKIRSEGPRKRTPIILCTVRSQVVPVAEGLSSGATDYVIKPFEMQDLLRRIAGALRVSQE